MEIFGFHWEPIVSTESIGFSEGLKCTEEYTGNHKICLFVKNGGKKKHIKRRISIRNVFFFFFR